MFADYYQVRDWLESFIPKVWGKEELGLARIENLLALLGNPERKFKSVHVAGTSGKGSTAYYTARLLQSAGFKVGLHISPHLIDIRERLQIFSVKQSNDPVSLELFDTGSLMTILRLLKLFGEIRPVIEKIQRETPDLTPSYFEILVAASFLYFAQEKVDWAVVEVGLGGRLDATNVLMPEVSVITNIGLDHTEILGDTIEKIAVEKAGIIKSMSNFKCQISNVKSTERGVPVVTGAKGRALKVIEEVARAKGSKLYIVRTQELQLDQNKKLALKVVEVLSLRVERSNLKRKIATSSMTRLAMTDKELPGRLEEIDKNVIIDGAHNPDKINFLIDFVISNFPSFAKASEGKQYPISNGAILALAFKKGKDWQKMVDLLIKGLPVKQVIATKFYAMTDMGKHQAVEPDEIRDFVISNFQFPISNVKSIENSQEAVFEALDAKRSFTNSLVLVTGSLYLVGEVRTMWVPSFM